jgi:uncharacterized protein YjbI with pentapeptide repeats
MLLYSLAIIMQYALTAHPHNVQTCIVLRSWVRHFLSSLTHPSGYVVIVTIIAGITTAYVGIYAIIEARHDRRVNRALFERNAFMTMVASGNNGTFIAAMKTFGSVQTLMVPRNPDLFAPWTWGGQEMLNRDPLHLWAASFFPLCTARTCGGTKRLMTWRIDLSGANLSGADLSKVDLSNADLSDANLSKANLCRANLSGAHFSETRLYKANLCGAILLNASLFGADLLGANLFGANLWEAKMISTNLREANLSKASLFNADLHGVNLSGADLHEAFLVKAKLEKVNLSNVLNLTQEQLNTACVDDTTRLPDGLT